MKAKKVGSGRGGGSGNGRGGGGSAAGRGGSTAGRGGAGGNAEAKLGGGSGAGRGGSTAGRGGAGGNAEAIERVADAVAGESAEALAGELGAAGIVKDPGKLVANLKTTIRRLMVEEGTYKKGKTYQVEAAASTMLLWRKIRDAAMRTEAPTIVETSRESDSRTKLNPVFQLYVQFTNLLRHDLRALALNFDAKALPADDEDEGNDVLSQLMRRRAEDDAEEDE